jgi:hypothetical protein
MAAGQLRQRGSGSQQETTQKSLLRSNVLSEVKPFIIRSPQCRSRQTIREHSPTRGSIQRSQSLQLPFDLSFRRIASIYCVSSESLNSLNSQLVSNEIITSPISDDEARFYKCRETRKGTTIYLRHTGSAESRRLIDIIQVSKAVGLFSTQEP